MQIMASVTIIYRKEKTNKNGEAPIHLRIIKHRAINYVSTGIRVPQDHWDEKNKRVKSCHKNSGRVNAFISKKFAEAQSLVLEHETNSNAHSSRSLRDKVFGKSPSGFFEFADNVVARYEKEGKIGTFHKNRSIIKKLKAYPRTTNLTFHDITPEFLATYEGYLRKQLGNTTNTINKDLKFIRKVFNDAIQLDVIDYETNPFRKYKLKTEKTQRNHFSEDEILLLENCQLSPSSRQALHRDMFIFAAYAGGLCISDVLKLQWKDFDGTHLNVVIRKTGSQLSIKAPTKVLQILQDYQGSKRSKDSFIFPMLPPTLDLKNPVELDLAISNATAQVNKNLKIIAAKAGIEKNCSFHISRHSFAVRALRKGISIDKLSKISEASKPNKSKTRAERAIQQFISDLLSKNDMTKTLE
jgi:integrase/recombinase XerD